jgi:hypothetical protein
MSVSHLITIFSGFVCWLHNIAREGEVHLKGILNCIWTDRVRNYCVFVSWYDACSVVDSFGVFEDHG